MNPSPATRAGSLGALLVAIVVVGCGAPEEVVDTAEPRASATPWLAQSYDERDLLPENVAFDPATGSWLVGSTRKGKIVRIAADGSATDFTTPRQDGLWMVMGMKVDGRNRHLWVASSDGDNLEGYRRGSGRAAGLFQYDLDDGALLGRWTLGEGGGTHFFNDVALGPTGNVYVTHMFNSPAVWVLEAGSDELQIFARPGRFKSPNGLAFGDDGRLYVAHAEGVSSFDTSTADRRQIEDPQRLMRSPADGLYFHDGGLIGIHPSEGLLRRYELDAARMTITAARVLVEDDPELDDPTTGVLVEDTLYYVANSQFGRLANGALPPVTELDPVVILALEVGDGRSRRPATRP